MPERSDETAPYEFANGERLAQLDNTGLLHLELSASLDALTRLAARVANAPVSLVSLVGRDFQFFKSAYGLGDAMPEGRRTPLSHSFCQHVVSSGAPLVIDDARQNPLVKDNFAVEELKVEAYLGVPIQLPNGFVMGSLCLIDHQPRHWTDEEVALLNDLVGHVMTEICLRMEVDRRISVEARLRESDERFRTLADNVAGLIFQRRKEADGSYSYCFFGNAGETGVGWRKVTADNPMPHRFGRVHPEDEAFLMPAILRAMDEERDLDIEYRTRSEDGLVRWVRSQSTVRRNAEGLAIWDGIIVDVSELKRARQAAEVAVEEQRNMLLNLNHDLRSPLSALIGFSEVLKASKTLDDAHAIGDKIDRAGRGVLAMVDRLLDAARNDGKAQPLAIRASGIRSVMEDSVLLFEEAAAKKNLSLTIGIEEDLPPDCMCDPERLREILANLIGNAVKYTAVGSIRLTAARSPASRHHVRFTLTDTGSGIPRDELGKIFDRFHRMERDRASVGGLGLGLAIVKSMTEAMDGAVGVESDLGKGSRFWVDLPLVEAEPVQAAVASVEASRPMILVADDQRANRTLVQHILGENGYDVILVADGSEAINAMRTWHVDLVFMDIRMPVIDGIMATKVIRRMASPVGAVPIVLLTASGEEGIESIAAEIGANAVLRKPFALQSLLTCASEWTGAALRQG